MSYRDIMEAQNERNAEVVDRAQRKRKRSNSTSAPVRSKKSRVTEERERGGREIKPWGMEECCAVLQI